MLHLGLVGRYGKVLYSIADDIRLVGRRGIVSGDIIHTTGNDISSQVDWLSRIVGWYLESSGT